MALVSQENKKWNTWNFPDKLTLTADPLCDLAMVHLETEHILAINDCRNNIQLREKTATDRRRENVFFESFERNFWPYVAVITSKDIIKNAEICVYYGEDYGNCLQSTCDWEQMCDYVAQLSQLHTRQGSHT